MDLIRLKLVRKPKVWSEKQYNYIPLVEKDNLFQSEPVEKDNIFRSEPKIPEFIPTLDPFSSSNLRKRMISQEVNITEAYDLYKKNE